MTAEPLKNNMKYADSSELLESGDDPVHLCLTQIYVMNVCGMNE